MNAREYLDILHVAERLKDTPRHCTTTKRRTESVAEHSWRISLMAFLLRHEFPVGECFTGDIPTFIKTDDDREVEDSLLNQWVQSLPEELSKDISELYKEMDAQETKEAKLYKSLDKLVSEDILDLEGACELLGVSVEDYKSYCSKKGE